MNGEPRRCLSVLEQKEYLSVEATAEVLKLLNQTANDDFSQSQLVGLIKNLSILTLAAQCLFKLNQCNDCCLLLNPLLKYQSESCEIREVEIPFLIQKASDLNLFQINPLSCTSTLN